MTAPPAATVLDDHQLTCLLEQGFPRGLAEQVFRNQQAFRLRVWIADNSGSMIAYDGRMLVETQRLNHIKWKSCTRWEELSECVKYHAQLAALLEAPTKFILLNRNCPRVQESYGVAEMGKDMVDEELKSLFNMLRDATPGGVTPLARHLRQLYNTIAPIADTLRRDSEKVVVCIATDGLPTNDNGIPCRDEFERELKRLGELPVWIVVRLCTDDDTIVQYYEDMDNQLELSLEVLDDYQGEAKQVYQYNPWLTYGLPLHRCREMGFHHRLLDLLDECPLTLEEIGQFCGLLLGQRPDTDPDVDLKAFRAEVAALLAKEDKTYNPIRRRATPWIEVNKIRDRNAQHGSYFYWAIIILVVLVAASIQSWS